MDDGQMSRSWQSVSELEGPPISFFFSPFNLLAALFLFSIFALELIGSIFISYIITYSYYL